MSLGTAAQPNLDSLYAVWKDTQRPDSVRADAYNNYVWDGYLYSHPDTAFLLAEELIAFADAHRLSRVKADAYALQGAALLIQGNYASAVLLYEKSLVISEGSNDAGGTSACLGNLGTIYSQQSNYPKALGYYQRALKLSEDLGHKAGIATGLGNLGRIYEIQGDHAKALEHFQRSLALYQEVNDKGGVALTLANIGGIHRDLNDGEKAMDNYHRALAINEELGDTRGKAITLNGIGTLYQRQGDHARALDVFRQVLALRAEIADKAGMAITLKDMGTVHRIQGEHKQSLELCRRALTLAQEIGAVGKQKEACQCLYDTYKAMGKGNEALGYLEQMRVLDDSLQASETTKKLEQMEFNRQIFADSVAKAEEARMIEAAHQEEISKKNRTRNYLALGGVGLLLVAGGLYTRARYMRRSRDINSKERDRSENLLLNILPAEVAEELKEKGEASARDFDSVSILFTDFKGFTQASEKLSAAELVAEINTCFKAFDGIVEKHGIEKIKTIGDAYMAAGGLPVPDSNAARNTVLAGLEMQDFMKGRKAERDAQGLPAFEMRVGIHTGPVVAGIVGVKKFQYDIWGDTVNTASRMESSGEVGKVNISEATYALVKDLAELTFTPRGKVQAKGKGEMEMYFVGRDA